MIKTLDWDNGDEQLHFVEGGNGDMYLQIWFTEYDYLLEKVVRKCRSIRIDRGNSGGPKIDPTIKQPLRETAQRYVAIYRDSEFEENKIWKATEHNHKIIS